MSCRIALLADIHGNAPALTAVLGHIDRLGAVDHVYSLGDMVSIGPDVNEVLAMLTSRPNVTMVRGNHEDYVTAVARGEAIDVSPGELEHQQWIARRLSPEFLKVLAELPRELVVEHAGRKLALSHYKVDPATEWYAPTVLQPTVQALDALYTDSEADVACFGHYHPVHLFWSARRLYVNPGSLGCCYQPVARYAVLDLATDPVTVAFHAVPYERREFLASYERLGVPDRDLILRAFHGVA